MGMYNKLISFRMKYLILVVYGLSLKNYFLIKFVMVLCILNVLKFLVF